MAQSAGFHEDTELLSPATMDRHRAIVSIQEELEAVDWYDQRVDAAIDPQLKKVLAHNRDEEKEHAAMLIEWLRRHDPAFDGHLRTYLFTAVPITDVEKAVPNDGNGEASATDNGTLGIGRGRPLAPDAP